ncbi:MAG: cytochrome P450 [Pseudonocardia sp.]|nr:cytochrome P450 [Pseudonocardia sp.]
MTAPPVSFHLELDAFLVTGYPEALAVLRGDGWSSDLRANTARLARLGAPEEAMPVFTRMMLFTDPPEHTRLRRIVAPSFTARAIERLRPRVAAIVDAVVAGLAEPRHTGDQTGAELLAEFAYPIPIAVIAELLDVGAEGAELVRAETPKLTAILEVNPDPAGLLDAAEAAVNFTLFLLPLLVERRADPGPDYLSALLAAEVDGERLDMEDVLATCLLLLIAGHETTANLIANGVLTLLRHPPELAELRRRPALITRYVEEILRLEGPVNLAARTAAVDHELAGRHIRAGQQVVVSIADANRDRARFAAPDRFDPSRTEAHLAFGAGAHFCLGAALSRLEAEESLSRLFARFPDLRLPPDELPRWRASDTFHALRELRVVLEPGRQPAPLA